MILQLSESRAGDGVHDVSVRLSGGGHRSASGFRVRLDTSADDRERVRWYFEDFLRFPDDPAPRIAHSAEEQLREWGIQLGRKLAGALFLRCAEHGLEDLWDAVVVGVADVRVEIESDVPGAGLPWELLRDPRTGLPIAAHAASFVRGRQAASPSEYAGAFQPSEPPGAALARRSAGPPRVLLVVSRPDGVGDVPFLGVAGQLLRAATPRDVRIDVLRPPGFARLGEVLGRAAELGQPYDVVHFDGHGTFGDTGGCLAFERPDGNDRRTDAFDDGDPWHWVRGDDLAALLRYRGVHLLVMNACRSAYSEGDLGSLAQEVADAGVPGVVAMRYNVSVEAAARFADGFYGALFAGSTVGAAAGVARRRMLKEPERSAGADRFTLQDWCVPWVHEERPLTFGSGDASAAVAQAPRRSPCAWAPSPDAGDDGALVGRDATILELDRYYDRGRVALLSSLAGSGKTLVARTFASWYGRTGGLSDARRGDGPVLFTSFTDLDGPDALFDAFDQAFPVKPGLPTAPAGRRAAREARERHVVEMCADRPLLWVWDAVDAVAGLRAGDARPWSAPDTEALRRLLVQLAGTRARILLTSRRPETHLLRDVPALRLPLGRMAVDDQAALLVAAAARAGLGISALADWLPVLGFADGNPRVIMDLVAEAAARDLTDGQDIRALVAGLQPADGDGEGHASASVLLGDCASLEAALTQGTSRGVVAPRHRPLLAALALFRDTAQSTLLAAMTRRLELHRAPTGATGATGPTVPAEAPERAGTAEAECRAFLEVCADLGLVEGPGQGSHRMHPALPTVLSGLCHEVFGPRGSPSALRAMRAYAESVTWMVNYYADELQDGRTDILGNFLFVEANLRRARDLALAHDWGQEYDGCTRALAHLHRYLGHRERWLRIADELTEATTDPGTGRPRPGRERGWSAALEFRVRLARDERDWTTAETLQHTIVRHARAVSADARAKSQHNRTTAERQSIASLAGALGTMGQIRRELGEADCLDWFEEALALQLETDDRQGQFSTHYNIAETYRKVAAVHDLDLAEDHFLRCLDLAGPRDRLARIQAHGELGYVAWVRHLEAVRAEVPLEERQPFLFEALRHYHAALADLPAGASRNAAVFHNQLGLLYEDLGDQEATREHLQEAVRLFRRAEEPEGAGRALANLAFGLLRRGRAAEARPYLVEALRHLESFAGRLDLVDDVRDALAVVDAARPDPLTAAQKAVTMRMRQAADDLTALPALATSLSNLGIVLSAHGRHKEGLEATGEAVRLLEQLTATDPAAHEAALASALHNLGNRYSHLGQSGQALKATRRAAEIRMRLADRDPAAHGQDLASTLRNLADDSWAEGRPAEALIASGLQVQAWRTLAGAEPATHDVPLARALDRRAHHLDGVGRYEEARRCLTESASLWRARTEQLPPSHDSELAGTLLNLSGVLLVLDRPEESLAAARESVAVLRHLADDGSAATTVQLAKALGTLGNSLHATGEWDKAVRTHEESVALWRGLVGQRVDEALAGLALTLGNLGVALKGACRPWAARTALEESVELLRPLVARDDGLRVNLAAALTNLAGLGDG
ncbi:tetratricopeptide (TPR) repeat protein [Streptomyces achromogenes]|uniref:tetratricopeptide repeat protein n=1 Tax=Streptomyces achromogenes TaxID=67255 RepID=UPI00278AD084|nr:tetratricopeptide repeat protein [Streptomyces achromogenes]MDQ0836094.1 tetratricopeptide (TPR) repeat protein [Streptomyces achromogenes]